MFLNQYDLEVYKVKQTMVVKIVFDDGVVSKTDFSDLFNAYVGYGDIIEWEELVDEDWS